MSASEPERKTMRQAYDIPGTVTGQRGVALLTAMLILMIMAVIGIASITLTGLENRLAGFVRSGEAASVAAESCLQTSVRTLESVIRYSEVPAALRDNASPAGPVPNANAAQLFNEISGATGYESYADALPASYPNFNIGVPNPVTTLNNFTVQGDIDRLQSKQSSGGSLLMLQGYEGLGSGSASGGIEILYQISCMATHSATNTRSKITAVFACKPVDDGCLRKI
jgi:hypothetical protein